MAPRLPLPSLVHSLRSAHPLGPAMRRTLTESERGTPEQLRALQDRRLRRMVAWAARTSPFYRSWFAENGVDPLDVRTQDDLSLLPLIDRQLLMAEPERFCSYPRRLMWDAHSSGTSGHIVTVYRTPGSSAYELNALQRQWSWFGVERGSRRVALRSTGGGLEGASSEIAVPVRGAHQLQISGYSLASVDPGRLLGVVRDFAPDAVEGWPSNLTSLATMLDKRGETLPVRAIITSSEVMTPPQVQTLERIFEAPVVDHYGQTERVTMAGNCEAGGYHLFSDYAVTELLPVSGKADTWEIVGTPLHNWGFPLLRYRTGDTVGPAPAGPCPCGRPFPLLGTIDGRVEDAFTSRDGRSLPLPHTVVKDAVGLEEIQIAQRAPGSFEVRMVTTPWTDLEAVESRVRHNVDHYFGEGQELRFVVMDRIPRPPSGKLKTTVIEHEEADPDR